MKSLNAIAENIAYKLGDQFNDTLKESIKQTIIGYRAKYIRDSLERGYLSELHFTQTLTVGFEKINLLEEFNVYPDCFNALIDSDEPPEEYTILKSIEEIPIPVRLKKSNMFPFIFVGNAIGTSAFVYTTLEKYQFLKDLKYQERVIYYIYHNKHIYIINNINECDINNTLENICKLIVRGIFENPSEAYGKCLEDGMFPDDRDFPCGADVVMMISNGILKGEYPLVPKDGEVVNIQRDVTNTNTPRR